MHIGECVQICIMGIMFMSHSVHINPGVVSLMVTVVSVTNGSDVYCILALS